MIWVIGRYVRSIAMARMMHKLILFLTVLVSLLLIGLGAWSVERERCPVQPSLPIWMILAGCLLALMSAVSSGLLGWNERSVVQKKTFLGSVGWALCWGLFLLFGYLIWFAVWIAGTYLSIVTLQSLRVVHQLSENVDNQRTFLQQATCHMATLAGAGFSILFIWLLSVALSVKAIISVLAIKREYQEVQLYPSA